MCTWKAPFSWRMEEFDVFDKIPDTYSEKLRRCIASCIAFHPEDRYDAFDLLRLVHRMRNDTKWQHLVPHLNPVLGIIHVGTSSQAYRHPEPRSNEQEYTVQPHVHRPEGAPDKSKSDHLRESGNVTNGSTTLPLHPHLCSSTHASTPRLVEPAPSKLPYRPQRPIHPPATALRRSALRRRSKSLFFCQIPSCPHGLEGFTTENAWMEHMDLVHNKGESPGKVARRHAELQLPHRCSRAAPGNDAKSEEFDRSDRGREAGMRREEREKSIERVQGKECKKHRKRRATHKIQGLSPAKKRS